MWYLVVEVVVDEIGQTGAAAFKQKMGKKRKNSSNPSDDPAVMGPGKHTHPDCPLLPHSDLLPAPPTAEASQKPGGKRGFAAEVELSFSGLQEQVRGVDLRGKRRVTRADND